VEVVGVLDSSTNNSLVLFRSVLGSLLCFLAISFGSFLDSLLLSLLLGLLFLGLLRLFSSTFQLRFLLVLALVLLRTLLLAEDLDALIKSQSIIN
jgi:hypothetical protein